MAGPTRAADGPRLSAGPTPRLLDTDPAVRFGLVALATDLTIEADLATLLPARARLHTTRVVFANPTTPENLRAMRPRLSEAAALIVPGVPLAALCFGCTSGSAVIGNDAVAEAFAASRPDTPVLTPSLALIEAAAWLGLRRIAVLTPYLPETTAPLVTCFEAAGVDVVHARCMGLADDRDMARVAGEDIVSAAVAADSDEADALFLSCTALPALPVIERIEAHLAKPVLTSNQVCAWAMLRAADLSPARRIGRLFADRAAA